MTSALRTTALVLGIAWTAACGDDAAPRDVPAPAPSAGAAAAERDTRTAVIPREPERQEAARRDELERLLREGERLRRLRRDHRRGRIGDFPPHPTPPGHRPAPTSRDTP